MWLPDDMITSTRTCELLLTYCILYLERVAENESWKTFLVFVEFKLASDLTSEEIHDIRLAPSPLRKK